MAPAIGASRLRLRSRNEPTALADAPSMMKTIENPSTNAEAEPSRLVIFPSPSLNSSTPTPESIET